MARIILCLSSSTGPTGESIRTDKPPPKTRETPLQHNLNNDCRSTQRDLHTGAPLLCFRDAVVEKSVRRQPIVHCSNPNIEICVITSAELQH